MTSLPSLSLARARADSLFLSLTLSLSRDSWMHKMEIEPKGFHLKMTDEHLRQLWEPTFTVWERW